MSKWTCQEGWFTSWDGTELFCRRWEPPGACDKAVILVHRGHERLGDAILAGQGAYAQTGAFPELLIIYHLLGDPALKLR